MSGKVTSNTRQTQDSPNGSGPLKLTVMSFGYKESTPPQANMIFDVRFLKNPYWVPELRPLTGLDEPVQEYVLTQQLAVDFLNSVVSMLQTVLPRFKELQLGDFTIALGCTGGQHRSTAIAEALAKRIAAHFPEIEVVMNHRELAEQP